MLATPTRGDGAIVLVAPHAPAPLGDLAGAFLDAPEVQRELAHRIAEWHDEGSDVALEAAAARADAIGLRPTVPRGVVDLNRGWRGRAEATETLFGKGALDGWVRANLRPGGEQRLEAGYRSALRQIR